MSKFADLTGQKFGRLTVVGYHSRNKHNHIRWLCKCVCDEETVVAGGCLKSGNTKSCGCLHKEIVSNMLTKHGHNSGRGKSRVYVSWDGMMQRCTNPNFKQYEDYGGRGIKVYGRWRKFENFLEDMGNPPTTQYSIDRINNDGNYCKSNCRWATRKEQANNRRNNRLETHMGKTQCLTHWAKEFGMCKETVRNRVVNLGWSIEKALTVPTK